MRRHEGRFSHEIRVLQQHVVSLQQRQVAHTQPTAATWEESVEELQTALEELHVAEEELYQQNQELIASQLAVEVERQRYQELFDLAPDGYLVTNTTGMIQEANRAAAAMLAVSQRQLVGKPLVNLVAKTDRKAFHTQLTRLLTLQQVQDWEVRLQPSRGMSFPATLTVAIHRDPTGAPDRVYWLVHDITTHKHAIEQAQHAESALRHSQEQLRRLAAHLQNAQEQERTRIAREIHDELAQTLTGLKMDVAWFAKRLTTAPPAWHERLTAMNTTLTTLFQTVRRIGTELRPAMLDELGLPAALTWYLQEVCQRAGLAYKLHTPPEEMTLDQARATALFRIFQEALTNVVRHAEASQVSICIAQEPDAVLLEVADNGKGCPPERLVRRGSMGLLGMRERASLWGGEVKIAERPGGGTTLTVRLPTRPAPV